MSERKWKPGDIALVDWGFGGRVMMRDHHRWWNADTELSDDDGVHVTARPLVVIDPENRDQTVRLMDALIDHCSTPYVAVQLRRALYADIESALREFANPTPPKPDEPLGLGAVVEDAEGERYVRIDKGQQAWRRVGQWDAGPTVAYDDIAAVKILSEGVAE